MTPEAVLACFTTAQGGYRFARWQRPIVPVVFGVEDATLAVVKGAIEAVATLAGHPIGETDPEMGANLMIFFVAGWEELAQVPDLEGLVPELPALLSRLAVENANTYRVFRFESDGTIRAAFVFLRLDSALADMAAADLGLAQMAQVILLWGPKAFAQHSPLVMAGGAAVLCPEIGALVRAAYDPVLPSASSDASHGLRIFARMGREK